MILQSVAQFHAAGLSPAPVDVICLGLAGFDRPDDRNLLKEWAEHAGWAHNILIVNDGDLVIAAGTTEGWGVGVIAGTGSIAVGRTKDGQTARAGAGVTSSAMKGVPIALCWTHCDWLLAEPMVVIPDSWGVTH